MKFIVSSNSLLKELQTISGVINSSNTLPILDNFLFELDANKLRVTASDLETVVSTELSVQSEEKGSAAIPARLLLDTLKTFPDQPLTFVLDESAHKVELASDYGKYALAYLDGDEFPRTQHLEDPSSCSIAPEVLASAITKTLFATGNDDLRPVMSGVFFQFNSDQMRFVSTDAHKLVRYTRTDASSSQSAEFIMPKKPLNLLKSILGHVENDVRIEYNESNARFVLDHIELCCRLIDGKYPNYEAVIPKDNPNKMTVGRSEFLSSVRRVSIFSNKTTHQIRLKISGNQVVISAEDLDFANKAEERINCQYEGEDIEIGFNSRFLVEMLSNLESVNVNLELAAPNRAGLLLPVDGNEDGEDVLMLVMPVMLNS